MSETSEGGGLSRRPSRRLTGPDAQGAGAPGQRPDGAGTARSAEPLDSRHTYPGRTDNDPLLRPGPPVGSRFDLGNLAGPPGVRPRDADATDPNIPIVQPDRPDRATPRQPDGTLAGLSAIDPLRGGTRPETTRRGDPDFPELREPGNVRPDRGGRGGRRPGRARRWAAAAGAAGALAAATWGLSGSVTSTVEGTPSASSYTLEDEKQSQAHSQEIIGRADSLFDPARASDRVVVSQRKDGDNNVIGGSAAMLSRDGQNSYTRGVVERTTTPLGTIVTVDTAVVDKGADKTKEPQEEEVYKGVRIVINFPNDNGPVTFSQTSYGGHDGPVDPDPVAFTTDPQEDGTGQITDGVQFANDDVINSALGAIESAGLLGSDKPEDALSSEARVTSDLPDLRKK